MSLNKEIIGLLYLCEYFYFIVGNYLIKPHELIIHHNHGENSVNHYSNVWYFHSTDDLNEVHETIIQQGFSFAQPVDGIPNVYKVRREDHPEIHHEPFHNTTNILKQNNKVNWAKQGFSKNLYKRVPTDVRSRYERYFNDELWKLQWYEQDYRNNYKNGMPLDMNLVPVYEELKFTGKGIRVAIIDDGIEYTHDDLKDNYDEEISINLNWNKKDPMPRYEDPTNMHGTRCAGEIAMAANNTKCGVGVAYNAKVGGIVLLDGKTDDEMEARALINANSLVDIYSGSWGPKDDGLMVDGPGVVAQMAFEIGATKVTSDINNTCTLSHTGTSAAAPLAAGVIALALEANGDLTWRDVQHLLVRNCEVGPLLKNSGWSTNAAGFVFNPQFGFGLLNAYKLVKEAISWNTVPEKSICAVNFRIPKNRKHFGRAAKFVSTVITNGCNGCVRYLEHVQLCVTIQYPKRGMVEINLRSPKNTTCKMMEPRPLDESNRGFFEWKIKSLQFWGEDPIGEWTVFVKDETSNLFTGLTGSVEKLRLIMHGTEKNPYN
ncbi:neuroendocrine convertase 1-like isoform X3 [Rhopalosiphum maidis]|uniref:neuroendocrine convertase 1-like isoform X3 n=1 Tax=Rhopalosiphum maidis TaxID=43146 RepID=UPI00101B772C|nr:neuroendocrine convertase 1-like isoform X3 [Rhopalosiphum maidis]